MNLDSHIANFANQGLVCGINGSQCLQNDRLDGVARRIRETLPQVLVVVLVLQVLRVHLRADIAAQDDSREAFGLNRDLTLVRVQAGGEHESVLVRLLALGCVQLRLGSLSLLVVVGEDLLQNVPNLRKVVRCQCFDHLFSFFIRFTRFGALSFVFW